MTAPTTPDFSILSLEGVDFTAVYSVASTTPELPGPPFAVGTHAIGTDSSEYLFVKASTAIAQWQAVSIDVLESAVVPLTGSLVAAETQVGFAQVAIPAAQYGWVALRGQGIGVLAKKGSLSSLVSGPTANSQGKLYVSGTSPGTLTTTSVKTSFLVTGIVLTTSCTSAMLTTVNSVSGPVVATATWPRGLL